MARKAHGSPEAKYQRWIEGYARRCGFTVQFHVRRSQVRPGTWVTNTSSPGVPDLWLINPTTGRLVVLEVKAPRGQPTPEQKVFIGALQQVRTVEAFVVKPADVDEVRALLDGE